MTSNTTYTVENKCISICIPCYNVERFLDQCLGSIFSSKLHAFLEVFVVNDGSKDRTLDMANDYAQRYPECAFVIDKENGGHGSCINIALERAQGKYFMVVDSDDWVNTEDLTKLVQRIQDNDYQSDLISMSYQLVDEETGTITPWSHEWKPKYECQYCFDEIDTRNSYFTLAGTVFRTDILKKKKKLLQEHIFYDDVEYILFPIPYVNTVLYSKLNIYRYRRGREEQSVYISNMIKRIDQHERILKSVLDYKKNQKMSSKQEEYYDSVLQRILLTHYSLCLDHMDNHEGNQHIREFDAYLCAEHPNLAQYMKKNMWKVAMGRTFCYRDNNACYMFLLKLVGRIQEIIRKHNI